MSFRFVEYALAASEGDVNDDIRNVENIMHNNACHISIPKSRKGVNMKTTRKSAWNKNIDSASKQVKTNHSVRKKCQKDNATISALRLLRKAQTQAYASQRNSWAKKIMTASSSDTRLFHRLIKRGRAVDAQYTKTLWQGEVSENS